MKFLREADHLLLKWNASNCGSVLYLSSLQLLLGIVLNLRVRDSTLFGRPGLPSLSIICAGLVATVSRLRKQWSRANQLQLLHGLCLGWGVALVYQAKTTLPHPTLNWGHPGRNQQHYWGCNVSITIYGHNVPLVYPLFLVTLLSCTCVSLLYFSSE